MNQLFGRCTRCGETHTGPCKKTHVSVSPSDSGAENKTAMRVMVLRIEALEKAITDLHALARSGESDIRAIGPILDRFPDLT